MDTQSASPFFGYPKIAESPEAWKLSPTDYRRLDRARWVVTEKIHGANFCFVLEGDSIRCANRRRLLAQGDSFFGYERVREALKEHLYHLFAAIGADRPRLARLFVYGELFGGAYSHPAVPSVSDVRPIQTGIWYTPDIRFSAFDLLIEESDESGALRQGFLDYEEVLCRTEAAGIPCVSPLTICRWTQALDFDIRFDSTIPRSLGLPSLPAGSNLAEGVIVRPLRELGVEGVRPILKRKIPEFAEDRRFHEAEAWEALPPGNRAGEEALDLLKWEAYNRITENRLWATASKIGEVERERGLAGTLYALLRDEVCAESRAAQPEAADRLAAAGRGEEWEAYVAEQVRTLLRTTLGKRRR